MKKKIIIIGTVVFILIIGIILIVNKTNNNIDDSNIANEFYNKYKENVDLGASSLMESETFNKMSEANQIKEMEKLLKNYESNGLIENLCYDEANKMFSFLYNYGGIEGAYGGVSLKKWDPMKNASESNCCTCLDAPEYDVCCDCDNPYLNK